MKTRRSFNSVLVSLLLSLSILTSPLLGCLIFAPTAQAAPPPAPRADFTTGWYSPSANQHESGGDGNGFETNTTYAYADGGGYAQSRNNGVEGDTWTDPDPTDLERYYNFNIDPLPAGATVVGIEVRLDWWLDSTSGTNSLGVELSQNGGAGWTNAQTDYQETTSEHTVILGGSDEMWGASSWTSTHLNNSNFRVRLSSTSSSASRDFRLDWVAVRVTYNRPPTTPDLASPTSGTPTNDPTPTLTWDPATDPDGDTLYYEISIDSPDAWNPTPGTSTSFTFPDPGPGDGTHTWVVRAGDDDDASVVYSGSSATWNFIVDTDTPTIPAHLYEGGPNPPDDEDYYGSTNYSMPIYWASVFGSQYESGISYELQRTTTGGSSWTPIYSGDNTNFADSINPVTDGTFIEYQVRACTNAGNCGGWRPSDGILIDVDDPAQVGGVGEGVVVGSDDYWNRLNDYYVYWNTVPDTGSGISYEVQRSVNGGSPTDADTTGVTCDPGRCWVDDPVSHPTASFITYTVRAVNGAGNTGSWSASSDGITIDSSEPESSVATGIGGIPYTPPAGSNPWPGYINGYVGDPGGSGVAQVHVRIQDDDTGQYWSGSDWSGTTTSWVTTTTTSWVYGFAEPNLTDSHTYLVESRATDVAGNVESTYGSGNFMYAATAPEAPVVASTTHLDPDTWYADDQPSFEWSEPDSFFDLGGYSFLLDTYPYNIPDTFIETNATTYDYAAWPDGEWYFHVRAVDVIGQGGATGHVRVRIDTAAPQAPAEVTEGSPDVEWDADGDIVVHWSGVPDTGSGIEYELERCVNGGLVVGSPCSSIEDWVAVASGIAGTQYPHNPDDYDDGDTVRYQVRATNGVGLSGNWTTSNGMTIDSDPLEQPDWVYDDNPDIDYHSVPNGAVTVYWDAVANTGSDLTYRLEKRVNTGDWGLVAEGLTGNSHADSGSYSDGDVITYRVTAVNGVGTEGSARESDGFLIDLGIPTLPDWVREGVNTEPDWDYDDDGTFTVYWAAVDDTGSGITYRLDKSVDGTWLPPVDDGISDTQYDDSGSYGDGAFIRYRITPVNGAGTEGPYRLSDGIIIDLDPPQAPDWVREGVPTDPDVDYDTDGVVWVYWDDVPNTGSGITYELQRRVNSAPTWDTIAPDLAVTSYDDSGTYNDDDFIEYQVIAHNGVGRSSAPPTTSDGVRVDEGIPDQPTGVGEGDTVGTDDDFDEDNTFYVYWTGVSATATGDQILYTVERNVNGSGWNTAVSGLTVTFWDDPQAYSNGDQVAYQVIAVNGAGTAGAASIASNGITIDTGRPNSEIDTSGYYNAVSWPDQIAGTASDDYSEVALVEITIYDTDDYLWWNGTAWASGGPYWLTATGTDNWTYSLTDSELTDSHNYDLQSRATDNAGNVETSVGTSSFIFADSGPDVPVISSSTHPWVNEDTWYNNDAPAFTWTTPGGPAPIVGYSYVLDQNAGTTPDTIYETTGNSAGYPDVPDGTWFFHVRALDDAGRWGPAGHFQINIDTTTPNAPALVTEEDPDVDDDYDGGVTVHWTAVPDTGSGIEYELERCVNGGLGVASPCSSVEGWVAVASGLTTNLYPHNPGGYSDGDTVRYRVRATNNTNPVGLSGDWTTSDGMTIDSEVLDAPDSATENAAAPGDEDYDPDGSVRVYWEAVDPTGSGLSYRLERRVTSGGIPGSWTLVAEGLGGTSYLDPLTHFDGDEIVYRVRAENGVGSFSVWQTSDGILIDTEIPDAPVAVTEDSPDVDWSYDGDVTVFWGGVSDTGSEITYELWKQVNTSDWTLVAGDLDGATTSYPDPGPHGYTDGDTVRYRVRATNGAGHVGEWRTSNGMTIDSSTVPSPGWVREENPDVDYDDNGALTVYWTAVSDTGSGIEYNLERCVDGGASGDCSAPGDWSSVIAGTAATDYLVGDTWTDGTEIVYRVTAVNGVETESNPAVSDGVTVDDESPAEPTGVGEGDTAGTDEAWDQDNAFYVFWTAPADTGSGRSYDIEKSLNSSAWVPAASGVVGTSWDDPVPYSNGDTVQYRIRAVSGAGVEGDWSDGSSGITLDFVRPDSAVSTNGYYSPFSWPGSIFGTSSDVGSDVAVVDITIQRASDSQYWNGAAWQGSFAWLEATSTINWQYPFTPNDGETYDVRSRATDNADNVETTYGVGSFTYSESGPEAPEISSPTHPNEATWYDDDDPTFEWTEPSSATGVAGYSYILDQNPGTTPDAVADTTARTRLYTDLVDGVWWFHVRALDGAGTWGPADHFAVQIDTTNPDEPGSVTEELPDIDFDADGDYTVYWEEVNDTGSGITYEIERDLDGAGFAPLASGVAAPHLADSIGGADGTTARYRVRAVNGVGLPGPWSAASDGVTIDSVTPDAPDWVREGVDTDPDWDWDADGSYTVYWDSVDNTGSGTEYRLYRRVNGGAWELVITTPATSYDDSGSYIDGWLIEYQVAAVNGAGLASDPDDAISDGIRIDSETPETPAAVTEEDPDVDWDVDGVFTVHWSAVLDTGSGITYRLERNLGGAGWTELTVTGLLFYADDIGNTDGTFAQYRVTAINGVGTEGTPQVSDGVTVDSQDVPRPDWVREDSATVPDRDYHPDSDGDIYVYWDDVLDTGSGITYRLEKRVTPDGGVPGSWDLVAGGLPDGATSYHDSGAYDDGDFIEYRVIVVNGVATESTPRVSDGMTIDTGTPDAPTGVGEGDTVGTDDEFDQDNVFYVYWTAPSGTGSGLSYIVERSRNGGAWEQATSEFLCTTTPCQWDDPVPYSNGDTVQYRVIANNSAGHSSGPSPTSSGITLDFTLPDSAITTDGFYNLFNWPGFIHGTANDSPSDVAFVDIRIQQSDGQYWNGAGWQAVEAWMLTTGTLNWQYAFAPDDGEIYNIRSRATDNAGNVEITFGVGSFTYSEGGPDAPEISSPTHPDEATWYNNDDPTLNWTTPSSGAGIQGYSYLLNHSATTVPDSIIETDENAVSFADLDDGTWYFHVRAQDNADNWGNADHFQVNIDTTAPAAPDEITEETPDVDWDSDGDVTVYWSGVSDTGSDITYRLERNLNGGGWELVAEDLTATDYADTGYANGDHVLYRVQSSDEVYLTSGWTESDGVSFDLTTPPAPANVGEGDVVGADDDWDQDNMFYVFWDAVPATPSGITYSIERSRNGGAWEEIVTDLAAIQWEDPTSYSSGESVAYRVTAHTGAGLSGEVSASSDGLTLDFVRPDSTIETNGYYNNFTWPGHIQGTATDDRSDVAYVDITLRRQSDGAYWDGDSWEVGATWLRATDTANWQYTFAPDDGETYDVQSRATDNADNEETTLGTSTFNYSSSGPGAPEISSPTHADEDTWYNDSNPTFDWTTPASGSGISGYSYVLDQAPDTEPDLTPDTSGNTRSYIGVADGTWYFHVRARDNAGNWGPPDHFQVNIDTTNPPAPDEVTEESPDVDWDADGDITVYWSQVTDTSDVTYILERSTNGGGAWDTVATGITTTSYLDPVTHGDNVTIIYHVRAVDAVDLASPWAQSNGVTIDSETPAQPTGLGEGDIVGTDDDWDEDNTFHVFWDEVANTGSGILYTIERSVDGGAWEVVQTDYLQTFWEDPLVFDDGNTIRYRVTAINGVGTVGLVSADSSGITLDFTRPDSAIVTAGTYGPVSWPGHIAGTANDDTSGVSEVHIIIQRDSDSLYWNGGAWVPSSVWLAATGTTAWTYDFAPDDGESYNVQSRATDAAGNREITYDVSAFDYTTSEPDSAIATSGLYVGAGWPGQIEGVAYAPMADVDYVSLTIRRTSDGLYFDGTTWSSTSTWLMATGAVNWQYAFTPEDGETYEVESRATDMVGNVEAVYGTAAFSYDAAAPEIETVTATSDGTYFYNPGLDADGGTVYFNSEPGEGADQVLTVGITFDEPHPASLAAATAFGDTPLLDTAAPWMAEYSAEAYVGTQSDVLFTVADTLGLTDTTTINFVQDNLPPESEASIAEDATNTAPVEIDWEASDTASGVYETHLWVKYQHIGTWSDTGLAMTGVSGSFVYTPTSGSGTYYFATLAVDNVGNVQSDPTGFGDDQVDFDDIPPGSSMDAPTYAITSPIVITWTASFDAKYTYLHYRYGETGDWHDVTFSSALNGTFEFEPTEGDGPYYLTTVSIDSAGNAEDIPANGKDMTIYDTTRPTSEATSPSEWGGFDFTVEWSGDDTAVGSGIAFFDVQVKVEGDGEWTDWITQTAETSAVYTAIYVGEPDATYHFRSRATDNAGHVEDWPEESNGDTTTIVHFPGSFPGKYKIFMPIIVRNYGTVIDLPDLVVTEILVEPAEPTAGEAVDIAITVENQGTRTAAACFWIDLYINPDPTRLPIEVNEGWFEALSEGGLVWSLCGLDPGESITLHYDDEHYWADLSSFAGSFGAPGTETLYAQVDSWNPGVDHGVVYESDEGNNVFGPHLVSVGGVGGAVGAAGESDTPVPPPPPRPNVPPRQ